MYIKNMYAMGPYVKVPAHFCTRPGQKLNSAYATGQLTQPYAYNAHIIRI